MKLDLDKQRTGRLYTLLKPFSPLLYMAYFQKTYIHNAHKVPGNQPVLLASNHPTAFIEPLLACTYLEAPVFNMSRGDIFRIWFFRKLMESINMFPIYRKRDGFTGRDRNDDVFNYCVERLHQKRIVNIFVEGVHHRDLRVLPAQKGIARIAFAAFEKYALSDLQIIPTGFNYTNDGLPRTSVFVNFGSPLYIRDYWPMYLTDPVKAIIKLCRDIEAGLKQNCFHVNNVADDVLAGQLLELHRTDHPEPLFPLVVRTNKDRFVAEKEVIDRLNATPEGVKGTLKKTLHQYFENLAQAGLKDESLCHTSRGNLSRLIGFLVGLIPFLIGRIGTFPILAAAKIVAEKKVTDDYYYGSVRLGVGFIVGLLYFPLILILSLFSGNAMVVGLTLLLPVLGWLAMAYRESFICWMEARRALRHPDRIKLLEERLAVLELWEQTLNIDQEAGSPISSSTTKPLSKG